MGSEAPGFRPGNMHRPRTLSHGVCIRYAWGPEVHATRPGKHPRTEPPPPDTQPNTPRPRQATACRPAVPSRAESRAGHKPHAAPKAGRPGGGHGVIEFYISPPISLNLSTKAAIFWKTVCLVVKYFGFRGLILGKIEFSSVPFSLA